MLIRFINISFKLFFIVVYYEPNKEIDAGYASPTYSITSIWYSIILDISIARLIARLRANSVQFSNHTGYPSFKGQVLEFKDKKSRRSKNNKNIIIMNITTKPTQIIITNKTIKYIIVIIHPDIYSKTMKQNKHKSPTCILH